MTAALNSLKTKISGFKNIKIEENYKYIKVLPENEEEFNQINSDQELNVYEYPLDYEIVKRGNKYKDPTTSSSNYTWLYCVIPITKNLKIKNQKIIEIVYLPNGNGVNDALGKKLKQDHDPDLDLLEEEALILVGELKRPAKNAKVMSWSPSGTMTVFDEFLGRNVPIRGAKVRTRKSLITYYSLTGENGVYNIDHSYWNSSEVDWDIKWDLGKFDIRSGAYGQAYLNGPTESQNIRNWTLNITRADYPDNFLYATTHRAAELYFYHGGDYGLIPPPDANGIIGQNLHLGVHQHYNFWPNFLEELSNRSHYFKFNQIWQASQVDLAFNGWDNSRDIIATTLHELAHAVHFSLGYTYADYTLNFNSNRKLAESWSQVVGWSFSRKYYADLGSDERNDTEGLQNVNLVGIQYDFYTPIFIDLIDNFNQHDVSPDLPNDTISGYTLNQIEDVLSGKDTYYVVNGVIYTNQYYSPVVTNWNSFCEAFISRYNPSNPQAIRDLFNSYKKP